MLSIAHTSLNSESSSVKELFKNNMLFQLLQQLLITCFHILFDDTIMHYNMTRKSYIICTEMYTGIMILFTLTDPTRRKVCVDSIC